MHKIYRLIIVFLSLGSVYAAPQIDSRTAKVDDVELHYLTAGKGPTVILLHGFAETSRMWRPIIPLLAEKFTVIAADLPGIGESSIPTDKIDMISAATHIHALVRSLGIGKARVVGHDIGLMVAYAYAAQYGTEVKKLALMDALLPGIEPVWSDFSGRAWWFGFFARPVAGDLVAGQAGKFLTDFWPVGGHVKDPFTKEEIAEFIRAYSVPGATTGSFHWFDKLQNQPAK